MNVFTVWSAVSVSCHTPVYEVWNSTNILEDVSTAHWNLTRPVQFVNTNGCSRIALRFKPLLLMELRCSGVSTKAHWFHTNFLRVHVNQQVKRIDECNRINLIFSYLIGQEPRGAAGRPLVPLLVVCSHANEFCAMEPNMQLPYIIMSIQNTFRASIYFILFLKNRFFLWRNCLITIFFLENISSQFSSLFGAQI